MTEDERVQHDSDYQKLLALFIALLSAFNTESEEDALYELIEERTEQAINHVLRGLGIDMDIAISLIQRSDLENLTQKDRDLRDRIIAAVSNLIDFSVCEEYQLYDEAADVIGDKVLDFDVDDIEDLEWLCAKYNDTYAAIENSDIYYAGKIAAMWMSLSAADWVVYWTQNDAKVRPWHMALQGYAAPRDEFPSWMIPPIEYNCRCFLTSLEFGAIEGKMPKVKATTPRTLQKPKQLSDVYSESLAKCGRIFGPTHNYFSVKERDKDMLNGFVSRLKLKYYGKN